MMERGQVIIEGEGAGFRVRLDPSDPNHEGGLFADVREARGVAGGIRLVTGRVKLDLTGEV